MDFEAEFLRNGFLSGAVASTARQVRTASARWFELATEVSQALQQIASRAIDAPQGTSLAPNTLATTLLLRSCGALQGAVLLLERAMVVEARTLLRSLVENSLCLAALHDKPVEFVAQLKSDAEASRKAQAKIIIDKAITSDPTALSRMQSVVDAIGKERNFLMKDVAELGSYPRQYLIYRVVSNDSAHVSATSLHRYLEMHSTEQGWTHYRWGLSSPEEVSDALDWLVLTALGIGVAITQILDDREGNSLMAALSERYRQVSKSDTPSAPKSP